MRTSVKFKNYKAIQKIGFMLLIIASVMTLAKILNVFEASHFIEEELRSYIFLMGGLLILLPNILKKIKGNSTSNWKRRT